MKPNAVVLHYTGMESGSAAEEWLCDPASQVSAHYLVHEDGRVVQMVPEAARAWHAGAGSWGGVKDVNSFSIGVEIANPGHRFGYPDFPDRQIEAVMALCRDVAGRHAIPPHRVLAHSDTAPGRKVDPGEKFPWAALAQEGIAHHVVPTAIRSGVGPGVALGIGARGTAVEGLQMMLRRYGYGVEATGLLDGATETVVAAFQRHFRPARIDGVADLSTRDTLARLIASLPEHRVPRL